MGIERRRCTSSAAAAAVVVVVVIIVVVAVVAALLSRFILSIYYLHGIPRKPILYLHQANKHVATVAKAGMQSPSLLLFALLFRRARGRLIDFI